MDLASSACAAYLKNLMALGIVNRETPITETSTRKTIYSIADSMFHFWYRFVPDNAALIQSGMADRLWAKVEPQLSTFMGTVFEEICHQWLWRKNSAGRLPLIFGNLGRWWGNDPIRKQEAEIDIMALADQDAALFAECKWINEKVTAGMLETLIQHSELFYFKQKSLYLFAKSGFTARCAERAGAVDAKLVTFELMNREDGSQQLPYTPNAKL